MSRSCEGRVAVVTGAGRGLGRAHALGLASEGALVVVNDLGVGLEGTDPVSTVAEAVVDEITAAGGTAVADGNDVADFDGARRLVDHALGAFGGLDVVVNNAGVLRDRMLVNLSWEDWELVLRVHLGATFAVTHHAARFWRERAKGGEPVDARVVNVTSGAGLYGNPGQANYSAAKAGIVGFTTTAALELGRYGVTVNALAPGGRTRMTEHVFADAMDTGGGAWDPFDPANVTPVVVWLASTGSAGLSGQVIEAWGGRLALVEGWRPGPTIEIDRRWEPLEAGAAILQMAAELGRATGGDVPAGRPPGRS